MSEDHQSQWDSSSGDHEWFVFVAIHPKVVEIISAWTKAVDRLADFAIPEPCC